MRPLCKNRLRGEEVHALVPDDRSHGERTGKQDVHQGDNHAARVRDAALQPVHAHVRAEERYVVGGVHHHTYVRVGGGGLKGGAVVTWTSTPTTIMI